MDWDSESPSPNVKFEPSPAESFLSMPGDSYPSLFGSLSSLEAQNSDLSALALADGLPPTPSSATSPAPAAEKKQTKKRKSWGQVLPEPKTSLPPRKRAKTEDEKEQRRVERVLRNRRAAQSSRERKRQEVEALEKRNQQLESRVHELEKALSMVLNQGNSGVLTRDTVTLSQPLFDSKDGHGHLSDQSKTLGDLLDFSSSRSQTTIDPTSLSPSLSPIPEANDGDDKIAEAALAAEAPESDTTSPDLTQHPAAVLCFGLQCQSAEVPRSWMAFQQPMSPVLALYSQLTLFLSCTSTVLATCSRPLAQIAFSLKAGFSLAPTPALVNTIIWLVTTSTSRTRKSTSTTSSTTKQASHLAATSSAASEPSRLSTTLRLKLLRKILTCSPMLARPLMDATMVALRLVPSKSALDVDRVARDDGSLTKPLTEVFPDGGWPHGAMLPSREVLLTLLWALKVEQRRYAIRKSEGDMVSSEPGRSSSPTRTTAPTSKYVISVQGKRKLCEQSNTKPSWSKRHRFA